MLRNPEVGGIPAYLIYLRTSAVLALSATHTGHELKLKWFILIVHSR